MGLFEAGEIKRERRRLAGREVSVAVTPPVPRNTVTSTARSLVKGMGVTLDYLTHPSKVVTRQYPENRATLKFPPRYRAFLRMIYDDQGFHRCTACRACERACPNASIKVISRRGPSGKIEIDHFIWRMDSCTFCNACVESCTSEALEMTQEFENAVYDRRLLVFGLNRYAGPPAKVLEGIQDPEARKALMEPRGPYDGPVPLAGHALPDLKPVGHPGQEPPESPGRPGPESPPRAASPEPSGSSSPPATP